MGDWLFDLGNSRLKFAPLGGEGLHAMDAIAHDGEAFEPGGLERLPPRIARAHVASVASPGLRESLRNGLQARGAQVLFAATLPRCGGVTIAYDHPEHLGVDRFLALLAAHARGGAWLVVGVGTATTVDLIDGDGLHRGGRIAPSPALMRAVLHARVPRLPAGGGRYRVFADDTADALASGCLGATLGLVEHSLCEAAALLGSRPGILLHGGGADAMQPHLPAATPVPALVLEGLAHWARAERG